jgi:threonyl-tRNA synthetase
VVASNISKTELATQMFPKDEWDEQDFEWKEQQLKSGYARPVMIHRAILGSVERFMAILIEHLGGKWPFFMSPRQAVICPVSIKSQDYCDSVYLYLHKQGYQVVVDHSSLTLNKKIRNHQLE